MQVEKYSQEYLLINQEQKSYFYILYLNFYSPTYMRTFKAHGVRQVKSQEKIGSNS